MNDTEIQEIREAIERLCTRCGGDPCKCCMGRSPDDQLINQLRKDGDRLQELSDLCDPSSEISAIRCTMIHIAADRLEHLNTEVRQLREENEQLSLDLSGKVNWTGY